MWFPIYGQFEPTIFLAWLSRYAAQRDFRTVSVLDKLVRWSEEWQMVFNVGKCNVMHFGRSNPSNNYFMKNQKLESIQTEKDLGNTD